MNAELLERRLEFIASKLANGCIDEAGAQRLREVAPWATQFSLAWEQENVLNEDAVRHGWHGADVASEIVVEQVRARLERDSSTLARWSRAPRVVTVRRAMPRARGARGRRVVRSRSSRGSPSLSSDPDESDLAPLCPRCGSGVVVLRGVRTCGACWAYYTLALEERVV